MKNENQRPEESGSHVNPLPSLMTLCNALCGFSAILHLTAAPAGQVPAISLWLIGMAMLFDMLDGWAARTFNAQSLHGAHLDSMADVISFCLAPAVLIHRVIQNASSELLPSIAWLAAALYLCSAIWRLAQFNTIAIEKPDHSPDFSGLPTPGAAGLVCCALIWVPAIQLSTTATLSIYLAYVVLCSFLMVSSLSYRHLPSILTHANKWIRIGMLALILASLIVFRQWALVAWGHLYVLYTPIVLIHFILTHQTTRPADMTPRV